MKVQLSFEMSTVQEISLHEWIVENNNKYLYDNLENGVEQTEVQRTVR